MAASQFLLLHAARTVKTCLWLMYKKPGSAGATCALQLLISKRQFRRLPDFRNTSQFWNNAASPERFCPMYHHLYTEKNGIIEAKKLRTTLEMGRC